MVLLMAMVLGGCGVKTSIEVKENGKSSTTSYMYLTDEEAKSLEDPSVSTTDDSEYIGEEEIDGVTYKVYKGDSEEADSIPQVCSKDKYVAVLDGDYSENESLGINFFVVEVTMPKEIVKTNGTLSEDKRTVTWNVDKNTPKKIYAYTTDIEKKSDIAIKTVNGYVKQDSFVKINSKKNIKYLYKDGLFIKPNAEFNLQNIELKANKVKFTKEGSYKFSAWTDSDFQEFNIKVDGTAPKTNVKEKEYSKPVKVTFSDKKSGVKKAVLDGKKIKSGTKVSKKGKHTLKVYDNVGNVTSVKFIIK